MSSYAYLLSRFWTICWKTRSSAEEERLQDYPKDEEVRSGNKLPQKVRSVKYYYSNTTISMGPLRAPLISQTAFPWGKFLGSVRTAGREFLRAFEVVSR